MTGGKKGGREEESAKEGRRKKKVVDINNEVWLSHGRYHLKGTNTECVLRI